MNRYYKKIVFLFWDSIMINFAVLFAMILRFDAIIPNQYFMIYVQSAVALTFIKLIIYYVFGLYNSLWRHASVDELVKVVAATTCGSGAAIIYGITFQQSQPRSVYVISWLIATILIGSSRFSFRLYRRTMKRFTLKHTEKIRVLVIGAGDAGSMVIKDLYNNYEAHCIPIAVIDDDFRKHKARVNGVPVVGGRAQIKQTVEAKQIEYIIIAIPSAPKNEISAIINICKETNCKLKTLPADYVMISGEETIKNLRNVSIEDLLGREEIELDCTSVSDYMKDEVILVTGGGGSIGSELCRQIAKFKPKKIIIFDIYENSTYDLQNELLYAFGKKLELEVIIGSVRDKERLKDVFQKYRPSVVFHAAAHKHVPLMEANPSEAIKNNVFGTRNVAECADQYGVKRFILISTDKAVNPTNIMGATKRLAEMIIQTMDKHSKTDFVAVRFGNVLGSNGSVIPLFKRQLEHGGPITVTHPEITRYFMTIPEAVRLVIQAGAMAQGGEIFILDMGEPVKILDLARDLIKLSGYEPDVDILIEFTGLRPGEKLYEELLLSEEGIAGTMHKHIFVGKPLNLSFKEVQMRLKMLENCLSSSEDVKRCMAKAVPTYYYQDGNKESCVG